MTRVSICEFDVFQRQAHRKLVATGNIHTKIQKRHIVYSIFI